MDLIKTLPFCLSLIVLYPDLLAQAGDLDPTFGTGGHVSTDLSFSTHDDANAVRLLPVMRSPST